MHLFRGPPKIAVFLWFPRKALGAVDPTAKGLTFCWSKRSIFGESEKANGCREPPKITVFLWFPLQNLRCCRSPSKRFNFSMVKRMYFWGIHKSLSLKIQPNGSREICGSAVVLRFSCGFPLKPPNNKGTLHPKNPPPTQRPDLTPASSVSFELRRGPPASPKGRQTSRWLRTSLENWGAVGCGVGWGGWGGVGWDDGMGWSGVG